MRTLMILLIKAYKLTLSPYLGRHCRFQPGCANYAMEAIERYGALRGGWLALKCIGRCQLWCGGGEDAGTDDLDG